jgi:hypothetical protein
MKVTICTIIRNQEHNLNDWYNQIKSIVNSNNNVEFYLSIYENNSTDKTKEMLNGYDFNFFKEFNVVSEDIENLPFFKGGYEPYGEESKLRVKLLSECRNKCMSVDFLKDSDYVVFIEPDIKYDPTIFNDILNFIHINDYDIVTAISRLDGRYHYDWWGTRKNDTDTNTNLTHLINSNEKVDLYATFNCFALYKTKPFTEYGCKFVYMSDILGTHDCDTVLVCQEFRKKGFNKICLLPNKIVEHNY